MRTTKLLLLSATFSLLAPQAASAVKLTLADHSAGQETDAFGNSGSKTDAELYAFQLSRDTGTAVVTQIVFSLTNLSGLVDGDWAGIEIVVDSNDDGTIGAGETTTVGGAGVISTAAKTITFSTSFNVSATTSYILRADFASLSGGDSVTIDLTKGNITTSASKNGSASSATHTEVDTASGLIGFWKLNDNTGTSATDSSGNSRTGTLVSGPTWTGGIFSSAVNFDEVNDHILITDFSYGPDFTWTFWFKVDDNSGSFFQYVFSHGILDAQNSIHIIFFEGLNLLRTSIIDSNDTADPAAFDITDTVVGTGWHSYALTVANGIGSKVYLDGVLKGTSTSLGGDAFNPTTNIFLAAREDLNSNRFLGGRLDDIRLYSRGLNAEEVQVLAKGAGLKGHWKLDDGAGTTATDAAGPNDGTLTNGPTWTTGRMCGAATFDGTNDYIQLADSSALISGDSSFTLSAWFKTTVLYDTTGCCPAFLGARVLTIYQSNAGTETTKTAIGCFGDNTDTVMFMYENPGVTGLTKTNTSFNDGKWHHLAGTYDASTNTATLYYDGANVASGDAGTIDSAGTEPAKIATGSSDANFFGIFNGSVDDVRVYDRALSASEIQALAATYTPVDLGAMTGANSEGLSVNASEQVAGFDENITTGNPSAWSSRFCLFTAVGTLAGGSMSAGFDINDSGVIVGWSDNAAGDHKAIQWTSGTPTDLGTLSGRTDSEAFAINSSNQSVGNALNFGAPSSSRLAFLNLPTGAFGLSSGMNSLGTLGGTESLALDINSSGQVAGGSQDSSGNMRPFIWLPTGTTLGSLTAGMNDLGTLGGSDRSLTHRAQAINSSGQTVGRSFTAGGAGHAFLWLPSAAFGLSSGMNDLGVLTGGSNSWAFGVNDSGKAVGTSDVTGGAFHAFLWQDDGSSTYTMSDLNNLIDSNTNWVLTRANGINSDGEVVGFGTNHRGENRGFLLTQTCSDSASAQSQSASFRLILAAGAGTTDDGGAFEEEAIDSEGGVLGEVIITEADPGETFEYKIAATTPDENDAPGPGSGTKAGFDGGIAFDRTLVVETSAGEGRFEATVSMAFSAQELAALEIRPDDVELHVLDRSRAPQPGVWVPAGENLGEMEPTGVMGDSGFVVHEDGSVDYWAVRESGGLFAVGARATEATESDRPFPPMPSMCGVAMLPAGLFMFLTLLWVRETGLRRGGRRCAR